MDGQKCETCRFWEFCQGVSDESDGGPAGYCRRFPPVWIGPGNEGEDDHPALCDLNYGHPTTYAEAWCGEYQPANPETATEGAATLARLVLLGDMTAARALADKLRE
jgi:hypothetical protein